MKDRMEKFYFKDRKWHSTKFCRNGLHPRKPKARRRRISYKEHKSLNLGKESLSLLT
jgi:hypothetical protein